MKIHEIIGKRKVAGDVGIELEMEGLNLPFSANQRDTPRSISTFWSIVRDGSLREGAEYIFTEPLTADKVPEALKEMQGMLDQHKTKPSYSFRTSTHVHVNVGNMEYEKVLNFIYLYSIMESLITNVCGQKRIGNRFCLRIADAEGCLHLLKELVRCRDRGGRNFPRYLNQDNYKYSAMNVVPMGNKGSIEFRAMEGHADWERLCRWVDTLLNLRLMAEEYENLPAIWVDLNSLGSRRFAKKVLMERYEDYQGYDVDSNVMQSASLSLDLVLEYSNVKEYKMPQITRREGVKLICMYMDGAGVVVRSWNNTVRMVYSYQYVEWMSTLIEVQHDDAVPGGAFYGLKYEETLEYILRKWEENDIDWAVLLEERDDEDEDDEEDF